LDPNLYHSTSYWRYYASGRVLRSPAGVTYTFDASGRPLTAVDAFGNQQLVTWAGGRIDHVVQTLGNGQSRQLVFVYDAQGRVASVSCQGRTWQYSLVSGQMVEATPPAGPPWPYS
jgi:hypothetical protein